ncbi:MAG: HDOD domain-containing protein [Ignavibacteriota bacterium]
MPSSVIYRDSSRARARLLSVRLDHDTALEEYEEIFRSDPSLAAELLHKANSAIYNRSTKVASIRMALVVLGISGTQALASSIALGRYTRKTASRIDTKPFWRHAIATAVIADRIGTALATHLGYLYTAGLTHDLGRLGLVLIAAESYGNILSKEFRDIEEASAVEKAIFGMSHDEAGAFLAQTWQFPEVLCHAMKRHHEVLADDDDIAMKIVQTACALAGTIGYPELDRCAAVAPDDRFTAGMSSEDLKSLVDKHLNAL